MAMDTSRQWMDLISTDAAATVQSIVMLEKYDMMVKKKKDIIVPPKRKYSSGAVV